MLDFVLHCPTQLCMDRLVHSFAYRNVGKVFPKILTLFVSGLKKAQSLFERYNS